MYYVMNFVKKIELGIYLEYERSGGRREVE